MGTSPSAYIFLGLRIDLVLLMDGSSLFQLSGLLLASNLEACLRTKPFLDQDPVPSFTKVLQEIISECNNLTNVDKDSSCKRY